VSHRLNSKACYPRCRGGAKANFSSHRCNNDFRDGKGQEIKARKRNEHQDRGVHLSEFFNLEYSIQNQRPDSGESNPGRRERQATPSAVSQMLSQNQLACRKDRLPPQLSRVVMSYRTNEWAKHLSSADAPDVDDLKLEEYPTERQNVKEVAAPVKIEELQQTAENAMPPPAPVVENSISVVESCPHEIKLCAIKVSLYQSKSAASRTKMFTLETLHCNLFRHIAQQALGRSLGYRSSSSPAIPQQIVESPTEENFPPTSPDPHQAEFSPPTVPYGSTSTLIGKRDTLLRGKYSYYGNPVAVSSIPNSLPKIPSHPPSTQADPLPIMAAMQDQSTTTTIDPIPDDDNISLSARRDLISQSSLQKLSSP
jgi:hypothetical protein